MKGNIRILLVVCAIVAGMMHLSPRTVGADEPVLDEENLCPSPGGQDKQCSTEADCALNAYATICVQHDPIDISSRRCEIPCENIVDGSLEMDRSSCAMGETCWEGKATPGRKAYYCRFTAFRVDLNLLDQAVVHHLEGLQPVFSEGQCSLQANLASLLDQNGDKVFDIFDLDLCVLAFLEQPGCTWSAEKEKWSCEYEDLVPCADDDACGDGLYCDEVRHTCQRDCGIIAAREESFDDLERECTGALKVCDYSRGRCLTVDVTNTICETDSQCPPGAYCLVGRCAPMCYEAAHCPGTDWYCSLNNRCRALPHPDADDTYEFDPRGYAIRFARDELRLDAIQVTDATPLVIMNLLTKKQVVDNPSVTFGYRLEVSYGLKQDSKCLKPFVDCTDPKARPLGEDLDACLERQDDCYVDDTEQWLQFLSPFGTLSAVGNATTVVALDEAVASKLTAGTYRATVKAVFDNGDSDTIAVHYVKASPSGRYTGNLTTYMDSITNALNPHRPLQFDMQLKLTDEVIQWNELMKAHNVTMNDQVKDLTSGYVVKGLMDGTSAMAFSRSGVMKSADDKIPFVGIYSPALKQIHLVGFIDVDKDFCITEDGDYCDGAGEETLTVQNLFGRNIRRRIEFFGPFDESTGLYHGIYREKITGLVSFDVTLEGGFRMDQYLSDDSDLEWDGTLLPEWKKDVSFPPSGMMKSDVAFEIAASCVAGDGAKPDSAAWAQSQFSDLASFNAYLNQAVRFGKSNAYSALGKTTIFPDLRQFDGIIKEALLALSTVTGGQQQQHLNVYDYVSSFMLPCDSDTVFTSPVCISETSVRCGLALHQKALLEGDWVNTAELLDSDLLPLEGGEQELFCIDTLELEGCPATPGTARALFVLQEHNRFWRDLGQILKFEADRGRSDAFLVMFRNEVDPFSAGAALSYKSERLRDAMSLYDELLEIIVRPAPTRVLLEWPIVAFKQKGRNWLDLMHVIAGDRMGALAELVDLQRRVFAADTEFVFANHMMQQEYLIQVYLMALQKHWQGNSFAYKGEAAQALERAQEVLNQLNPKFNEIGVQGGRVFFENSDGSLSNWENYRKILVGLDGQGGLLGEARGYAIQAVEQLQAALHDMDELEESLQQSKFDMEDRLAEICGDPTPGDPTGKTDSFCQYLAKQYADYEDWKALKYCIMEWQGGKEGKGKCAENVNFQCPEYSNYIASNNSCEEAKKVFIAGTKQITEMGWDGDDGLSIVPGCNLDSAVHYIKVHGSTLPCIGGEMGALLQEDALLELKQKILVGSAETVLKKMSATIQTFSLSYGLDQDFATAEATLLTAETIYRSVMDALVFGIELGGNIASIPNCNLIAGLAFGTNCIGNAVEKSAKNVMKGALFVSKSVLDAVFNAAETAMAITEAQLELKKMDIAAAGELLTIMTKMDGLIDEFRVLTQERFNLAARIDDLKYQAQFSIDRYNEQVGFIADHLVGRESGYVLRGDALVRKATNSYAHILQTAYRMTMAFNHHYNLSAGQGGQLVTKALSMVTLDDVDDLASYVDQLDQEYCGMEAIDCDYSDPGNAQILRFSIQENLFPQLHDIVDGKTGKVVTAGQQFHNLITQPPYVKRRVRGVLDTDQIELPFAISMNLMENTGGEPKWMLNPLECNQHLAAGEWESVPPWSEGSVAVQVVGHNLGGGSDKMEFELVRGGMDFMRGCHPESTIEEIGTAPVLDYPIRQFLVGYAPQSSQAQEDTIPAFVYRSQAFAACMGTEEPDFAGTLNCWNTFARDRALAAPDWKIVAPMHIGGGATDNTWIMGDGLTENEKPVVEDIILYFRYYSRPIEENF